MAAPNGNCRAQIVIYDGTQSQSPVQLYWNDNLQRYSDPANSYKLFWYSTSWVFEDALYQQWVGGAGEDDPSGSYVGSPSSSSSSSSSEGSLLIIQISVYDSPCSPPTSSASSSSSSSGSSKSYSSVSEGEGSP